MKKRLFLPLILTVAAAMSFAACGGEETPEEKKPTPILDKTELMLCVGGQDTLTLSWIEESRSAAPAESEAEGDIINYRWESSDETIVTLTAEGDTATLSAVEAGTAVVTVYLEEEALATCNVTVVTSPLSITVPEGRLVVRNAQTVTVRVKSVIPLTEEYVWSVSDSKMAKIESQGELAMITATARGECTITVQNGIYTASFTLIVGLNS